MDKKVLAPYVTALKELAMDRLSAAAALLDLARDIETAMDDPRHSVNGANYLPMYAMCRVRQYEEIRDLSIKRIDEREESTINNMVKDIVHSHSEDEEATPE